MPNCFQLCQNGRPVKLQEVDDRMREHFGAEPDKENWFRNWYNTVGLGLAMGHDWEGLREHFADTDLIEVIDWLEGEYQVDAWVER